MAKQVHKETIVVRKDLDFGITTDVPKYWMAGNAFKTRMIDVVQATFPDGERYFISSVRLFKDRIKDPDLIKAVKDFSFQEGQHGKVHTDYNQRLMDQGLNIEAFTKHTRRITERRLKKFSPEYNVALTAALEHFTAMMADMFFAYKEVLEGADPRVRAMLAWHAVEEMEHKSVAFDVMQKVAKVGYGKRVLAMTHATVAFSLFTVVATWIILGMDGLKGTARLKEYAKGLAWLFHPTKGVYTRLLPKILTYYRPGFHPEDLPTVHNYRDWLDQFVSTQDPVAAGEAMYEAAY